VGDKGPWQPGCFAAVTAGDGRDPAKERGVEAPAARRAAISLAVLTADAFEARRAELNGGGTAGRG
jgi:hypothetical protein